MSLMKKTATGLGLLGTGLTAGWIASAQVAGYQAHDTFTYTGMTSDVLDHVLEDTETRTWNGHVTQSFFAQRTETIQNCGLSAIFTPTSSMNFTFFDWDKPHPETEDQYLAYTATICKDLSTGFYNVENLELRES